MFDGGVPQMFDGGVLRMFDGSILQMFDSGVSQMSDSGVLQMSDGCVLPPQARSDTARLGRLSDGHLLTASTSHVNPNPRWRHAGGPEDWVVGGA